MQDRNSDLRLDKDIYCSPHLFFNAYTDNHICYIGFLFCKKRLRGDKMQMSQVYSNDTHLQTVQFLADAHTRKCHTYIIYVCFNILVKTFLHYSCMSKMPKDSSIPCGKFMIWLFPPVSVWKMETKYMPTAFIFNRQILNYIETCWNK